MLRTDGLGEVALEFFHLGPEDELAGAQDALEGGLELPFQRAVLRLEIEQGDGHDANGRSGERA